MINQNYLLFVLIPLSWAINSFLIKCSAGTISLDTFNAIRFLCVVPVLFFVPRSNDSLKKLFLVALFWFGLNFYFQGKALSSNLDLGYFALGTVTTSLFIIVFSILDRLDTITRPQIIGFSLAMTGFLVIAYENSNDLSKTMGLASLLASNICVAIGTVLLKKFNITASFSNIAWISLMSAVFLFATSTFENGIPAIHADILNMSLTTLFTILFSAFVITLWSGKLWVQVVQYFGTTTSSFSLFLVPAFSLVLAGTFLGETISAYKCIALAFILSGVFVATTVKANKPCND